MKSLHTHRLLHGESTADRPDGQMNHLLHGMASLPHKHPVTWTIYCMDSLGGSFVLQPVHVIDGPCRRMFVWQMDNQIHGPPMARRTWHTKRLLHGTYTVDGQMDHPLPATWRIYWKAIHDIYGPRNRTFVWQMYHRLTWGSQTQSSLCYNDHPQG